MKLAAPTAPMRTRMAILRDAFSKAANSRDVANLMIILQEGLYEGFFLGIERFRWVEPTLIISVKLNEPPWAMHLERYVPRQP